jgi:hypothetical protein
LGGLVIGNYQPLQSFGQLSKLRGARVIESKQMSAARNNHLLVSTFFWIFEKNVLPLHHKSLNAEIL